MWTHCLCLHRGGVVEVARLSIPDWSVDCDSVFDPETQFRFKGRYGGKSGRSPGQEFWIVRWSLWRDTSRFVQDVVTGYVSRVPAYISGIPSTLIAQGSVAG